MLICFVLIPVRLKLKFWNSILLTFLHQGFLSTKVLILHLLSISLLSPSNKWNCNYFYFILYQYASINNLLRISWFFRFIWVSQKHFARGDQCLTDLSQCFELIFILTIKCFCHCASNTKNSVVVLIRQTLAISIYLLD